VLLEGLFATEGSIAGLAPEDGGACTESPQVLLESLCAAEGLIAVLTVESRSMRRRVPQVLQQSCVAVESSIAEEDNGSSLYQQFHARVNLPLTREGTFCWTHVMSQGCDSLR